MSNHVFAPGTFTWALGIEDTCVYPGEGPALDEYVLTQHDTNWAADLTLAADLGATAIRYGASWPLIHLAPGEFAWSELDKVVDHAADLGLSIIADLVHYGCPTWLARSFADPGFPGALEEFAGAFASHFRGRIDHITPLNEPVTTASFSGLRGVWPPYGRGCADWVTVTLNIAEAVCAAQRAVHEANPDAVVVHVEAALLYETDVPELGSRVEHLTRLALLPLDLVTGRVVASHPLHGWLVEHGAAPDRLRALAQRPARLDVLGVNYYPDLSPRRLVLHDGVPAQVAVDRGAAGLARVLTAMAGYGLPLAITETSVEGDDDVRSAWLREASRCAERLRSDGLDLRGLTWWPLMDFVDWSFTSGGHSVEEFLVPDVATIDERYTVQASLGDPDDGVEPFLRRMGVVRLDVRGTELRRVPTAAADVFRALSSNG